VLDTNLLISAVGWKGKPRAILDLCIDNKLKLIESPQLIDEFIDVINRPKFSFIEPEVKIEIIISIFDISEIIEPNIKLDIVKEDEKDNRALECALAGNCDYIISGDSHLLKLQEFEGIKIYNASKFLKKI
jgi:putative PIN family toxin of toxin-antitoxin system